VPLTADDEERMIRYLLDDMEEAEKVGVEERYLLDAEFFESIAALEEELIRNYLRGELPPDQRLRFKSKYESTPALARKVAVTRAVMEVTAGRTVAPSASPPRASPRVSIVDLILGRAAPAPRRAQFALAGVWVLTLGCGIWLALEATRLHSAATRLEAARLGPVVAAFVLEPGARRGDQAHPLLVSPGVTGIRFQLDIDTHRDANWYRAVVETARRRIVWSGDLAAARDSAAGKSVFVEIPAGLLESGAHILELGIVSRAGKFEPFDSYTFEIDRR
jgi:hypothetical protein